MRAPMVQNEIPFRHRENSLWDAGWTHRLFLKEEEHSQ